MYDLDFEEKQEKLISLLENFLGEPKKHYGSKGQISFDCPNCSYQKGVDYDGKGNLEVNYEMGVYNCWACSETHGTKGKLFHLFKEHADKETYRKFVAAKFNFTDDFYDHEVIEERKDILTLPEEYIALAGRQNNILFKAVFNYLYGRGITDEIIEKYKIGYCLSGKYENRVVIPSYDKDGFLNYFVTRAISDRVTKNKYQNPDVEKLTIIFNELLIDWNKPVFIVEGAFDHIVVPNSIPLLGKKFYDKIFEAVYLNAKNLVIIVLDPDALNDAKVVVNKLDAGRLRNKVLINSMPENMDVSKFNEVHGTKNLHTWLATKNKRLID